MNSAELYAEYKTKMQKIADVKYASAVLQWDQETYLPPKGNDFRGRQVATLSEIAHEQFTDEKLGDLLTELLSKNDLSGSEKRNIELSLEDYTRNKKIPADFVRTMSETVTRSYHDWANARSKNSFPLFENSLHQVIELKKREADYLGYEGHPYNALMNDYDKGLTVAIVDNIFNDLKPQLLTLLDAIKNKPQVDSSFLHLHYDKDTQWKLGIELLTRIGFDFEAGRQDISLHPFTTNFNNVDVRVTTRVDENDLGNMTWSCLHEGGHALYEQGLPGDQYGLPLGEYCSLSIHESQSRLWENCVGRGLAFWQHNFNLLKTFFPNQLKDISEEKFYKGINKVQPSLIRTEADELTYHFHVMIRYEIEKALIEGSIMTKDIPAYWNEQYKKYLGVIVPNDQNGCLQDIHWSHGSFGYFATYSLGSLYAAQLYAAIERENKSLEKEVAAGNNGNILKWLRKNIHEKGRLFLSEKLCLEATGETLNPNYFIDYATKKYTDIYS
ncbi:carboxypeptidase M32 [Ferruginibacter lapsinanis]|uniref:carboxypeptidase M32 n=1 Tax=Ferruginibacter lapsinanis TaxID=563172 RepID=UPI001E45B168|nr:carboxypeptidase M32 [Ferruginibacter lapsinanis]UEG49800.1 carboxypeptidase M32 [Ferruginibacter lapsinanis]